MGWGFPKIKLPKIIKTIVKAPTKIITQANKIIKPAVQTTISFGKSVTQVPKKVLRPLAKPIGKAVTSIPKIGAAIVKPAGQIKNKVFKPSAIFTVNAAKFLAMGTAKTGKGIISGGGQVFTQSGQKLGQVAGGISGGIGKIGGKIQSGVGDVLGAGGELIGKIPIIGGLLTGKSQKYVMIALVAGALIVTFLLIPHSPSVLGKTLGIKGGGAHVEV